MMPLLFSRALRVTALTLKDPELVLLPFTLGQMELLQPGWRPEDGNGIRSRRIGDPKTADRQWSDNGRQLVDLGSTSHI